MSFVNEQRRKTQLIAHFPQFSHMEGFTTCYGDPDQEEVFVPACGASGEYPQFDDTAPTCKRCRKQAAARIRAARKRLDEQRTKPTEVGR